MKNIISFLALSVLFCGSTDAGVLATPRFDTDVYVLVAISHEKEDQLTIGESKQGTDNHGHFNVSIIEFDVSKLQREGKKFLRLSAVEYRSDGMPGQQKLSKKGSTIVQLIALGETFKDFQKSENKELWYDTHVQNKKVPIVATFKFTDLNTVTADVTEVVNGWITKGESNKGFALFSTSNNVELGSMTYKDESKRPALVDDSVKVEDEK